MKRRRFSFLALVAILLAGLCLMPAAATALAHTPVPPDSLLHFAQQLIPENPDFILAFPVAVSLSKVSDLFRPKQIAQVITKTESYGTPVLDRFFPERTRRSWPMVMVPIEEITRVTRAVPVVLRGAPGITITGTSGKLMHFVPQPIKTVDGFGADEYNNAAMVSADTVQMMADNKTARHVETHRKTTEALAAQSLTGTITFPLADQTGQVVDTYTVAFGTVAAFAVTADWSNANTKISTINRNLTTNRNTLARAGFNGSGVVAGEAIYAALLDKVEAVGNDTRLPARLQEDGGIRIGEFVIYPFSGEYYHPGGPGGANPAPGYTKVVGDDEVVMYDPAAPWTLLRVKLDNFKLDPMVPMGVISEMSKDGSIIELFFESKPFPVAPVQAILRGDATAP